MLVTLNEEFVDTKNLLSTMYATTNYPSSGILCYFVAVFTLTH